MENARDDSADAAVEKCLNSMRDLRVRMQMTYTLQPYTPPPIAQHEGTRSKGLYVVPKAVRHSPRGKRPATQCLINPYVAARLVHRAVKKSNSAFAQLIVSKWVDFIGGSHRSLLHSLVAIDQPPFNDGSLFW
jgi:hypothetical protein